ncbi:hypothetical protein ACJMK2_034668 [Sinanodonta woodiana]|uniref:EGF-like domain-containing protein n=1 Tax=Sinanodonta woodiana TaxID=1069815 RepID=A0ABD3WSC6_SINWO
MGWEGTECNTKVITDERDTNITCGDVNECRKGVCTNGTCCCNKGYSGVLCHSEILECESKPCLNGGTCKDGIGEFRCNCSPEYTGLQCETPIPSAVPLTTLGLDKCQSNHCQNNATCVFDEHLHVTYCVCPSGIIGDQCQNVQYLLTTTPSPTNCRANYYGDDCKIYCIPADSCDDGHYVCEPSEGNQVCRAGWKGKRCNVRVLPMEKDTECPDLGCKNDGVCFNRTCCCRSGFYGKNCENFDIGCSSHPCQNGGTCRDDNSSYSCLCLKGYTGKSCEKDIRDTLTTTINPSSTNTAASSITYPSSTISLVNNDSCLRTLCLNGGTCYLNATVATCKCPYEYTGSTCEIVSPTTPLGISSTVQAMTINNFTNGHTTIFPNKTIENQSLGLSSSTSTLLTVSIQPSKSSIVSYVSETVEVSTSTHLSNTSVLFNLSGLTTEGNTHELTITTTSSYEIKYATNVPSMDTSFGIKTSLSVFHDMSPSYSSHVAYLTSVSLNLESTSLEFSASTVKDLLATATEHYSSISSYETYKGLTTVSTSSAVNAVSPTKSSSTQIKVSSSFSPKRESSTSLNLVIQSTPSILTSINKNTISVNTLQTVSSTNMELQPSSSSIAEGTSIMTLYNKTSTFITSSKYLTHPQPPNSVAVTNTFPPSPSAGSTSIIMTTMIGGLNISITNLNKITTTPRQLVTSTTPKGENITKDTQPSVFYLSGRIHKTVSALKTLKALVQQALGSKGLLHWLDIRHFVDKQGHPFTQAQFNLTNGYLADEDFLKEIEKSVASSTSLQRAEASVFKGDTTDLIDLSKAHTINLVGYIYSKTDIEEAILNAWKTDTINPDIQIVDLEYCLGEYGIKLTRLSYLANSNGRQVMPWEISQDRRVQIAKVFESLDLNRLTSSAVSWPFANTFGLTVNQQHVTFKSSGTEETISSGWRRCLESNGTTCKEKCNVSVVLGRPERTIVDMSNTITRLWYLPEYRNDHMKGTWTNPASYGTMTSMEELLGRLNISVVRAPVAKLYRISLLHERQMSEFKNVVEKALLSIWISFHSLHSADSVKIQTVTWNVSYLSDNGTIVTVIGYRVSVLDADSSFSSLTEPQLSVVEEGLQKHGIASCSCTPHSRREIYVFGDILPDNFSDFQGAISDAWNETNKCT